MQSEVKIINDLPTLVVNGVPVPEIAYITYCLDRNCYADFASAGIRLYSVNLNFSEMPINEKAPALVFQKGIFENDVPDFGIADRNFKQILEAAPDAYIFPRININLSESWETAHPDELCDNGFGKRRRVSFASDLWAEEVRKKLVALIKYIEESPYAEHIIGYQLAGGNTEEWFPLDDNGFYGKRAKEKFSLYCGQNNIAENEENYYKFASELIADRILQLAATTKEAVNRKKIIGAFYGYTIGCVLRKTCHHALSRLLESDNIDFICSPIIYVHGREPGLDLYPMVPTDSLRIHGKLYFSENDIRTHLSRPIKEHPYYTLPIWFGPNKEESAEQLKLSFCRALIHGYGMWWFDMWGGWYKDSDYMELMSKMTEICSKGMDRACSEVALFIDEKCYSSLDYDTEIVWNVVNMLGLTSAAYDIFLASDFDRVFPNYKACIFIEPAKTALMTECIKKAAECGKAVKVISEEDAGITREQLKDFLKDACVTMPTKQKAVVYTGEKYVSLYVHEHGTYDFELDGKRRFTDLFTGQTLTFPTEIEKTKCFLFQK